MADTPQDVSNRLKQLAARYDNSGNPRVASAARAAANQITPTTDMQVAAALEQHFNASLPGLVASTAPRPGAAFRLPDAAGNLARQRAVVYQNEVRVGGTAAWRNNNPGNVRPGRVSAQFGAIGQDPSGFAIFPTRAQGDAAQMQVLLNNGARTIRDVITNVYAPASDGNRPDQYVAYLQRAGLNPDARIDQLTDAQRQSLQTNMQAYEGQHAGQTYTRDAPDLPQWTRVMFGGPATADPGPPQPLHDAPNDNS